MTAMMPGVPASLYYIAVLFIMIISFVLFVKFPERKRKTSPYRTVDLLKWRWLERWARSRIFQALVRLLVVFLFVLVIFTGLFGIPGSREKSLHHFNLGHMVDCSRIVHPCRRQAMVLCVSMGCSRYLD